MLCVKDKANMGAVSPGVSLVESSWGLRVWGAGAHNQVSSSSHNQLPQHPQHCCIPSAYGVASF